MENQKNRTFNPVVKHEFIKEYETIQIELQEIERFISSTVIRFFHSHMDDHTQERLENKRKQKKILLERLKEITVQ